MMNRPMTPFLIAVLALAVPGLGLAETSAQQKAASAQGLVVTNDNLQQIIKNSHISIVGSKALIEAERKEGAREAAQAASDAARASGRQDSQGATEHFTFGISLACQNRRFAVPAWCPVSADDPTAIRFVNIGDEVDGRPSRVPYDEIDVRQGDTVEITLNNSAIGGLAEASFIVTSADVIKPLSICTMGAGAIRSDGTIAPGPVTCPPGVELDPNPVAFGVSYSVVGSRVIRFVADKAGVYKYYDGMNRSGYGVLRVNP